MTDCRKTAMSPECLEPKHRGTCQEGSDADALRPPIDPSSITMRSSRGPDGRNKDSTQGVRVGAL